jgi:hypothetical protein
LQVSILTKLVACAFGLSKGESAAQFAIQEIKATKEWIGKQQDQTGPEQHQRP